MPIAINGSGTITGISAGGLPDGVITTDDIAAGAVTQAKRSEQLTLATAQASTSGTSIDFTGIPSWVKRVTVMFNGVSTNGTSLVLIQLGTSSGVVSTGYNSTGSAIASTVATTNSTNGFVTNANNATDVRSGIVSFVTLGSNVWAASGVLKASTTVSLTVSGDVTLSGTLDRLRITTVNGTDTFDAGSINILYE